MHGGGVTGLGEGTSTGTVDDTGTSAIGRIEGKADGVELGEGGGTVGPMA
jgi:hypothetical protein